MPYPPVLMWDEHVLHLSPKVRPLELRATLSAESGHVRALRDLHARRSGLGRRADAWWWWWRDGVQLDFMGTMWVGCFTFTGFYHLWQGFVDETCHGISQRYECGKSISCWCGHLLLVWWSTWSYQPLSASFSA